MPLSGVFFVSLPYLKKFSAKIQIFCGKAKPELVKVWDLLQIKTIFSIPYLGKGEKTKRVCHRLMTHPLGLWVAKHAIYCQV